MNCGNINFGMSRRDFFGKFGLGLGGVGLFSLLRPDLFAQSSGGLSPLSSAANPFQGVLKQPHFPAKAKRIIYLFMAGGPSQLDLLDRKSTRLNSSHGYNPYA